MSQQDETMGHQDMEPDDLLSPQPRAKDEHEEESHTPADATGAGSPPASESEPPKATADPMRRLVRVGWAMVAVLVILAALIVAGMVRITTAVNRVACVQKAQANYAATTGQGATAYELSLARLAIKISLNKCGQ